MVRVVGQGGSSGDDRPPSRPPKDGKVKALAEPKKKKNKVT